MALSNVSLTDTFYTWLTRTNQLVVLSDETSTKSNNAYNTANSGFYTANLGFDKANAVAISANAWTNTVVAGANGWANIVVAGANSWVNTSVAGANGWTNTVYGYINTALSESGSNAWTNTVFGYANTRMDTNITANVAAANGFANTIGVRANAWTNTVFGYANTNIAGANAWVNTSVAGANAWSNTKVTKAGDTMTGALIHPAGTVTAPSITFTANTLTGMWLNTTNTLAFSTVGKERMKIDPSGNAGINIASPLYQLHVGGIIYATDDIVSASDLALKENIEPIMNSMDILEKLKPIKYNYKNSPKVKYGLIAQEVKDILPDVVTGGEGNYGVGYLNMIALLIDSVKNLNEEVKKLKDKINDN